MRDANPADESWEILRRFLPADLEGSARERGAVQRARGEVRSAAVLLRLIVLHAAGGLSLEQAVRRARDRKLVKISAVALFKRLRSAGPWLAWLTAESMKELANDRDESSWAGRPVRVLDGVDVEEPGPTGMERRLRYALRLPDLGGDRLTLEDARGSRSAERLPVEKGDIIMCSQEYGRGPVIARILARRADVVMRLESGVFPLVDGRGRLLDPARLASRLRAGQAGEWPARFAHEAHGRSLRLCALRRSLAAAARGRDQAEETARALNQRVRPEALQWASFVFVLTSLPSDSATAVRVLALERARWRAAPVLKRLKGLLAAGPVPKTTEASSRAWLQARILTALLIERMIRAADSLSPWGYSLLRSTRTPGLELRGD